MSDAAPDRTLGQVAHHRSAREQGVTVRMVSR